MSMETIVWAAGFFDGEGSISIGHITDRRCPGRRYHSLRVQVSQVDPRPLIVLCETFGGSLAIVDGKDRQKNWTKWTLCGTDARDFLVAIRSYVVTKGEVIDVAMRFISTITPHTATKRRGSVTPEVSALREELRNELMAINRKD